MDYCKHCADFENIQLDKMERHIALVERQRRLLRSGQRDAAKELDEPISAAKAKEREATHRLIIHKVIHLTV